MNKYLKFEYWNTCDLGNIYYQGGQHFIFYLDADVGEPIHEEVEEGQENGDGDFIPTYRRQMKRYRIRTGLIPDYLIDAIQRMKLHDTIELTFKSGEVEQIYNVDCEPEWQFEKYAWQGTVTLTFDMDESITVGACCDNLTVTDAIPEWYWIATDGSDDTGDGHYTTPWKTLAYACTQVTTPGETIHVKAGTYTETAQSVLAVGVSIIGAGDTSIITTATALDPIIKLDSAVEGTDGNQSISYIKIDGDLIALRLIEIHARSHVSIHHCTFIDALNDGVLFFGRTDDLYQFTTTYSTGNSFYSNTVTNCSRFAVYDTWRYIHGCLAIGGQSGMLIYDNTITQPDRGDAANGACITFTNWGNHKGTKIYNNTLTSPPKKAETGAGGGYGFSIELWSQRGGIEIYDNDILGGIDLGGYDTNDDGGYGYAVRIHDNNIGLAATSAYNHNLILLELGIHDGVYIYKNYFNNASRPITFSTTNSALVQGQKDIYFYYNIFNNVRLSGAGWFGYCFDINPSVAVTIDNLNILNNIAYAPASLMYAFIQSNDANTTFTDMVVRNNIVCNAHACVEITNGTITGINVDNNDFYNTSHVTDYTGATVTGDTYNNNITTDPTFVTNGSDFHLQAGSPCINAGINVGLTTDYDGQAVDDPPEIGAYEYQE